MASPGFLGIDVGTSGVRAVLIDEAGRVLAEGRAALPASQRDPQGHVRQDPWQWWHALLEALEVLAARAELGTVAALAVDATSGTVLVVDPTGQPLEPARMYDDCAAAGSARRIAERAPPHSGAHGPGSGLAKAMELKARHPRGHILTQADWLAQRLGAPAGASDENNALKLGYDPVERRWPAWVAELLPELETIEVFPPGTAVGTVSREIARRFGLPSGAVIAAGSTDSVAAALAAGIEAPGDAVTALGSTLALKLLTRQPVFDPEHGVYSHRLGEVWLAAGASNSGGAVLARHFTPHELERLSRCIEPQRDSGLDYYPLNTPGERFPIADPGLLPRLTPRPEDDVRFLHGLLEGIARIERQGYRLLARLSGTPVRRVLTSGGGAVNATWSALRQRLLGVPVCPARHTQAAVGAALLARAAHQGEPPLTLASSSQADSRSEHG